MEKLLLLHGALGSKSQLEPLKNTFLKIIMCIHLTLAVMVVNHLMKHFQ